MREGPRELPFLRRSVVRVPWLVVPLIPSATLCSSLVSRPALVVGSAFFLLIKRWFAASARPPEFSSLPPWTPSLARHTDRDGLRCVPFELEASESRVKCRDDEAVRVQKKRESTGFRRKWEILRERESSESPLFSSS